jgi:hypothetical protein
MELSSWQVARLKTADPLFGLETYHLPVVFMLASPSHIPAHRYVQPRAEKLSLRQFDQP